MGYWCERGFLLPNVVNYILGWFIKLLTSGLWSPYVNPVSEVCEVTWGMRKRAVKRPLGQVILVTSVFPRTSLERLETSSAILLSVRKRKRCKVTRTPPWSAVVLEHFLIQKRGKCDLDARHHANNTPEKSENTTVMVVLYLWLSKLLAGKSHDQLSCRRRRRRSFFQNVFCHT